MPTNRLLIIGGVAIVLVAGVAQFLPSAQQEASPQPTPFQPLPVKDNNSSEVPNNEGSTTNDSSSKAVSLPSIAVSDVITSWDTKGVYVGNPDLVAKAESEIVRLSALIGKGEYPDTTLYVAISGQYRLLGNGKQEYDYLVRAIQADGTDGLPWHNLGVLMERLGAYETARVNYEKATLLQPARKQYHYAYIDFLLARLKDDTIHIEKAFAAAERVIGQDPYLAQLKAGWQKP